MPAALDDTDDCERQGLQANCALSNRGIGPKLPALVHRLESIRSNVVETVRLGAPVREVRHGNR